MPWTKKGWKHRSTPCDTGADPRALFLVSQGKFWFWKLELLYNSVLQIGKIIGSIWLICVYSDLICCQKALLSKNQMTLAKKKKKNVTWHFYKALKKCHVSFFTQIFWVKYSMCDLGLKLNKNAIKNVF